VNYLVCCPSCNDVIVKDDGAETKIRSRVLLLKGGNAFAVCKGCGKEVQVPVSLDQALVKSLRSTPPKLYISGKKPIDM
jgi:RNase P subunit RPR2